MSAMTARTTMDRAMSEAQLQAAVIECAQRLSWRVWHDNDSRRNQAGLPDLLMVRGGELIFAELKTSRGQLRKAQREWLDALGEVMHVCTDIPMYEGPDSDYAGLQSGGYITPVSVEVWRPADWVDGTIERRLR